MFPPTSPLPPPTTPPAPVAPPTLAGPTISAAWAALAQLTANIGQRWVNLMWGAAQSVQSCEAKVRAAADALLSRARQVYEDTGFELELASYNVLAAAQEVAQQQGCPPVTPNDLMRQPAPASSPFSPLPGPKLVCDESLGPCPTVPAQQPGPTLPGNLPIFPGLQPPGFDFPPLGVIGGPNLPPPLPGVPPGGGGGVIPGLDPVIPPIVLPFPVPGLIPPPLGQPAPGGAFPGLPDPFQPGGPFPQPPLGPFPPQQPGPVPPLPPLNDPPRPRQLPRNPGDFPPIAGPLPPPIGPPVVRQPPGVGPGGEGKPDAVPCPPAAPPCGPTPVQISLAELLDKFCPKPTTAPAPGEEQPPEEEEPPPPLDQPPGETAPPLPAPGQEPPGRVAAPLVLDFESDAQCRALLSLIGNIAKQIADITVSAGVSEEQAVRRALEAWVDERVSGIPVLGRLLLKPAIGLVVGAFLWAARKNVLLAGCTNELTLPATVALAVVDLIEKWLGLGLGDLKKRIQRVANFACPTDIPTLDEATQQYLAGQITTEVFHCLARANNRLPSSADKTAAALRTRPNVADNVALYLRGQLTLGQLTVNLANLGVLDLQDVPRYLELAKFIPPPTDLTRFLVRDVFDPAVVDRFQYDQNFDQKFQGQAKAWANAQGMTEEQFKFYWRAHWQLPSAGQAFNMLHRLRPGRVPESQVVTRDDVRQLLEINDMAPFWQDRLTSISYNVLRLVDLRNAYFRGAVSEDELYQQLQDRGYDTRNAGIVRDYFRISKVEFWLKQPIGKEYLAGLHTTLEMQQELTSLGVREPTLSQVKDELVKRRERTTRLSCVSDIKRRYMRHEIDDTQAFVEVESVGYSLENALELTRAWGCQRPKKSKEATAAQLCQWVELGLVGVEDATVRLIKMGYAPGDADRIMDQCGIAIRTRLQAKITRAQAAAAAASQREARKREQLARQAASAAEKTAKQLRSEKRAAERREAKVSKLANLAAGVSGRSVELEREAVALAMREFAQREGVSAESALELIEQAIGAAKEADGSTWFEQLVLIGQGIPPLG